MWLALAATAPLVFSTGCGRAGTEEVNGSDDSDTDETTEGTEGAEETEPPSPEAGCDEDPCERPHASCGECDGGDCNVDCAGDAGPEGGLGSEAGPPDGPLVEVGIPDQETSLYFEPLSEDGEIDIRMGGQGGTHALIAIQCSGFGNRVVYQVEMKNLDGDGEIATLPLPRPRPIACDGDVCRISPIFVLLGGLAEPEDWDGLHVEVTATVSNEDGLEASDTKTGYLDAD